MSKITLSKIEKKLFAKRFNFALDIFGVPPKHQGRSTSVAELFNLTPKGASRWVNGEVLPPTARRKEIAALLRVNFDWLEYGQNQPYVSSERAPNIKALPILTWEQARDLSTTMMAFHGERLTFTTKASDQSFALYCTATLSNETLPPGCCLVIDPLLSPILGDFVLFFSFEIQKPLLKQLLFQSDLNLAPGDQILGVVVEMKRYLR